jgi:hypothetical protein
VTSAGVTGGSRSLRNVVLHRRYSDTLQTSVARQRVLVQQKATNDINSDPVETWKEETRELSSAAEQSCRFGRFVVRIPRELSSAAEQSCRFGRFVVRIPREMSSAAEQSCRFGRFVVRIPTENRLSAVLMDVMLCDVCYFP